jgi:hypothetical protein
VFKRFFRVTFKLGLIAAVGFGIAVVVKKLTAPADTAVPIEPWPPLPTQTASPGPGAAPTPTPTNTNGDTASDESPASTS